jgi:uncharacterized SAM-binding protein YcdF (DUF218 family)
VRALLLTSAAALLIEGHSPEKADAVVVLGGDENGARILTGAQLVQAGWAPYVAVSGPYGLLGPESDALILYAVRRGFPANIFRSVPNHSDSTRSESIVVGKYLKQAGVHKILLVTSNYHTHRAAYLWKLNDPWLRTVPIAAADPDFIPTAWWKKRNGQKLFVLEWAKTIATYLGQ